MCWKTHTKGKESRSGHSALNWASASIGFIRTVIQIPLSPLVGIVHKSEAQAIAEDHQFTSYVIQLFLGSLTQAR